MRLDSRLRRRLGLALVATPVALQFVAVALLGVNTILGDEFFYVDFIRDVREGRSWWHWLALQHNEHRVVPMKLVMAPLALLTHWDTRAEMYVSGVLAALTVLGLWHLYRRLGAEDLLFFAPAAWLVCSFAQYENMLYGMMMCLYFTVAGAVWALVMLAGGGPLALAGAVLCALIAAFSIVNGALIWPLGLALLLLQRRWRGAAVWSAIGGMALIAYFHGFQLPPAPHAEPAAVRCGHGSRDRPLRCQAARRVAGRRQHRVEHGDRAAPRRGRGVARRALAALAAAPAPRRAGGGVARLRGALVRHDRRRPRRFRRARRCSRATSPTRRWWYIGLYLLLARAAERGATRPSASAWCSPPRSPSCCPGLLAANVEVSRLR